LDRLATQVQETVSEFLPSIRSVELRLEKEDRYRALSGAAEVIIDDGNKTSLASKGEGVQSLVALALMRESISTESRARNKVIAIEEPESHLHPKAVHELREVITELSQNNQVVLTTHSPLFASPKNISGLIIVKDSKATQASTLKEVRECLGVRLSENLTSARMMLMVEGTDDKISLESILPKVEPRLKAYLDSGEIIIDPLGGASHLPSRIGAHRANMCLTYALLDNDAAGKSAVKSALDGGLIKTSEYTLTTIPSMNESEFEDYFDPKTYKELFIREFGVDPTIKHPTAKGKKWSSNIEALFKASGKIWNDNEKSRVKFVLAKYAAEVGLKIIKQERMDSLKAFASSVVKQVLPE